MLGAIIGDIVGSRFEFNNIKTKTFEFFSQDCEFTDDSIMSLAIAKAIMLTWQEIENQSESSHKTTLHPLDHPVFFQTLSINTIKTMQDLGRRFQSSYGNHFLMWLQKSDPQPYNSYGNGSAMRISPIAYIARKEHELLQLADTVTAITHNHPEGIKGAQATALAIYLALQGCNKTVIRERIIAEYYPLNFTIDEIRPTYQFDESCQGTVPQAIQAFLESESFEDAIRIAVSVGGDTDTLAAITGSIAGAYYTISEAFENQALAYLKPELFSLYNQWQDFLNSHDLSKD